MASNNYRPPPQHYYPSSPPTHFASPTLSEQGSMRGMASPPPAYQQPYLNGYNSNDHYRPQLNLPTNRNSDTLSTFIPNAPILRNFEQKFSGTPYSQSLAGSHPSSSPHNSIQSGGGPPYNSPTPSHATIASTASQKPLPQRKSSLRARDPQYDTSHPKNPQQQQAQNRPLPPPTPTQSQSTPPRRTHSLRNRNPAVNPVPGNSTPPLPMPRMLSPPITHMGIHEVLEADEHVSRQNNYAPSQSSQSSDANSVASPQIRQMPQPQMYNGIVQPPPRSASRNNPVPSKSSPLLPHATPQSPTNTTISHPPLPIPPPIVPQHTAEEKGKNPANGPQLTVTPERPQRSDRRPSSTSSGGSPKSSVILDSNNLDPIIGGVQRKHNSYVSTVPSLTPFEAVQRIHPDAMHILITKAVADSKEYGVLPDLNEHDEFKAEYRQLDIRVRSLTESHSRELRILHSAQDLLRMMEQQQLSGGQKVSRTPSFRTKANHRELSAAHEKVREAEAHVRNITTELWHAFSRMNEVQRRILEHTAATLNVGMRRLDDGNKKLMQRVKATEASAWLVPENVDARIEDDVAKISLTTPTGETVIGDYSKLPPVATGSPPDVIYVRMKVLEQAVQELSKSRGDDVLPEIKQLVHDIWEKKRGSDAQDQSLSVVEELRDLSERLEKDDASTDKLTVSSNMPHRLTMGSELRQVLDSSLLELTGNLGSLDSDRSSAGPSILDFQSKGSSSVATSIDPTATKPETVTVAEMQEITQKHERLMEELETEYKARLHEEVSFRKKTETEMDSQREQVSKLNTVVHDLEGLIKSKQKDLDERDVRIEKEKERAAKENAEKDEAIEEVKKQLANLQAEKTAADEKLKDLTQQLETTNAYKNKQLPVPTNRANKVDTMSAFLTNYLDDSDEDEDDDDLPVLPSHLRSRSPLNSRSTPSPNSSRPKLPAAVRSRPSYDLNRDDATNTKKQDNATTRQNIPYGVRF
ncbi:Up-regulated during septation-domain-containing protein [Umbelopsis sp. PMI_123]|nr:Up-regulated during septation-domain-containing protein [Umbelopsis sp. PMI_123]